MLTCCALIGEAGTGKTSFAKRHLTGEFVEDHIPSGPLKRYYIEFSTSWGDIQFNLWEATELCELDYLDVKCAIIMTDASCSLTYSQVPHFQGGLKRRFGNIPVALCENKSDLRKVGSKAWEISYLDKIEHISLSVKNMQNLAMPFLWLCRQLVQNSELTFVANVAPLPPNISNRKLLKFYMREDLIEVIPPIVDDEW